MRISEQLRQAFREYFSKRVNGVFKLYLFGSRAQDHMKGGDIDLLLLVDDSDQVTKLKSKMMPMKEELRELAGDQKVDLLISTNSDVIKDPFLKTLVNKIEI